jgi:hypothetical protein
MPLTPAFQKLAILYSARLFTVKALIINIIESFWETVATGAIGLVPTPQCSKKYEVAQEAILFIAA